MIRLFRQAEQLIGGLDVRYTYEGNGRRRSHSATPGRRSRNRDGRDYARPDPHPGTEAGQQPRNYATDHAVLSVWPTNYGAGAPHRPGNNWRSNDYRDEHGTVGPLDDGRGRGRGLGSVLLIKRSTLPESDLRNTCLT